MEIADALTTAVRTPIRTPDQRVRVFVSSTLGELAEERQAARASIEQLRLTPIMFELGARPHPPRALYRSYLAQSDIFVGIYWQRYGWVAPDMDISGLEDELHLATRMPRLIYVKRPAPDMDPRLADMLRGLQGEEGPSYKPFGDVEELQELLLNDLALLLAERFQQAERLPAPSTSVVNLPAPTSLFVGRQAELEQLQTLLDDDAVRLVTLAGPGGTGKTRLAIEAARAAAGRFGDGVFFVDLTAERQPEEAFAAIARTLEVGGLPGGPPLERVKQELRQRQALLVLDNLEQVTTAGPGLVELLAGCARVKLLVTSREVLRVSAEHVYPVPVLSLPTADPPGPPLEDVLTSEAGRLFVERASAAGSGFAPRPEDAADIAAICHRLDGLPLALELAAARVKIFSLQELRAGLERRLDLLTGGAGDRPSRQRTLRDAIEWSEGLLTREERTIFWLFSVFVDARLGDVDETLRALPAVNGVDVVEVVSSLLDKNLIHASPGVDRRPRFSMLQTIREYAAEQLGRSPELMQSAQEAHAAHYAQRALDLHRQLRSVDRKTGLAAVAAELDNLRAAWQHCAERHDVARLDDLIAPLWGYHEARGDYRTVLALGEELLRTMTELPDSPKHRNDELALRANLARTRLVIRGFGPDTERALVDALARLEAAPTAPQRSPTLRNLAALQLWRGDFERGSATARELMAIAQHDSDPALLAEAHLTRCVSTTWPQDLTTAIEDTDKATAYFEAVRSDFVAFRVGPSPGVVAHAIAGLLRWTAGLPDSAARSTERGLRLADELAHPYSKAFALHHAALLDLWRSDLPAVEARAEESKRLAEAHDYAIWRALALIFQGAARARSGRVDSGLAELEEGFGLYQKLSAPPIFWPSLLAIRATTHAAAGDTGRALGLIEEARASLRGKHPATAEVALAHADILLDGPTPAVEAARTLAEQAAALSTGRGARMLELEALTRLAAIDSGSPLEKQALRRLRELYETFTEGHDAAPLRAAAAVLSGAR
jgi:predicted ATPase